MKREDAAWDDIDWSTLGPEPAPAPKVSVPPAAKHVAPIPQEPPAAVAPHAKAAPRPAPIEAIKAAPERNQAPGGLKTGPAESPADIAAGQNDDEEYLPTLKPPVRQSPRATPPLPRPPPGILGAGAPVVVQRGPSAPVANAKPAQVVVPLASVASLTLEDGTEITIKGPTTVGRHRANSVIIQDIHVSARHARFDFLPDGSYTIVDLNSSGHTFVNGTQIHEQALKNGDIVSFATVHATFRYVSGPKVSNLDGPGSTITNSLVRPAEIVRSPMPVGRLSFTMPDGKTFTAIVKKDVRIGRTEENDIVVNDPRVSALHARLQRSPSGKFELINESRTAGTCVNGKKIDTAVLSPGCKITFGVVQCVFDIERSGR